jgi:hypothetical protein
MLVRMRAWLLVLAGCRVVPPPAVVVEDTPKRALPEAKLSATDTGLGPLDGQTPANLVALRAALAGFEVMPANVGGTDVHAEKTLEYQVFDRGEQLLRVVPTEEGSILHVLITSPSVAIAKRDWRVGTRLAGASHFTECTCWGGKPVCFKEGEHVAVGFDRKCGGTRAERRTRRLEGATIAYLVWSPRGFGGEDGPEYPGVDIGDFPDPCGP